jgi:hypothetical protein
MLHEYDQTEHNPNDHEDPLPGPTWIVGVGGSVVLIVVITALTALFYQARDEQYVMDYVDATEPDAVALAAEQAKLLTGTQRIEIREEGDKKVEVPIRTIPIDQAMEQIINRYGQGSAAKPAPRAATSQAATSAIMPKH